MRNPLGKRFKREIRQDVGKYIAVFLFMVLSIGFISGFLVSGNSMRYAYDESFDKYNIEDGNFVLKEEASDDLIRAMEDEGIELYEQTYIEAENEDGDTYRIYENREKINKISLHYGRLPENDDEIAIDRLYAANNNLKTGDMIILNDKQMEISGLAAFSDYSALFKENSDLMFDAQDFTVASVNNEAFEELSGMSENFAEAADKNSRFGNLHYAYAWKYDDQTLTDGEKKDKSDDLKEVLAKEAFLTGNEIESITPEQDNQAIHFTDNDFGSDRQMTIWFMYIIMVIMAFLFAVTTANMIEKEAGVIGTLRASGYRRGELIRHYMTLPLAVTIAACIAGNILGYTLFEGIVADLYYGSYSLPPYEILWNSDAFVLTTVSPVIIMIIINLLVLSRKLTGSPLTFLRGETRERKKSRAVRLPDIRFMSRFRIRIILQNKAGYFMLLIGIIFANVLLMFGMMFSPLLEDYQKEIEASQICKYQYVLKSPVAAEDEGAERYALSALNYESDITEEISVFGIEKDSEYIDMGAEESDALKQGENKAVLSSAFIEKKGLKDGDKIELKDKYTNQTYKFTVVGSTHYPSGLAIFIDIENYNELFDNDEDYFTGYFSDTKLKEIDDEAVVNIITEEDLKNTTRQLSTSLGSIFSVFSGFAIVTYILMLFVLTKVVLDKNRKSISMIKILGYSNREISKLYNYATAVVVTISLLISLPVAYYLIKFIYMVMMQKFSGWITFGIRNEIFPEMFIIGIVVYALFSIVLNIRIRKIPMGQALKNTE